MTEQGFAKGDLPGAARLMRMLSSEKRLKVLCRLQEGESSVGDLAAFCDLTQPAISQLLKSLKDADLVQSRRAGQVIYYSLKGREVSAILEVLYALYCSDDAP